MWCIPCLHNLIDSKLFNFYSHRYKPLIVCICCWDFVTKTSCLYVALLLSQMFCCRSASFFCRGIRVDRHKSDRTLSHTMLIFPAFQRGLGFLRECIILRLFFLKEKPQISFLFWLMYTSSHEPVNLDGLCLLFVCSKTCWRCLCR